MHRPDFDVIRRKLKGPLYRDAMMMPHINLDDLSSPKNLLNLIYSRCRLPPEHFAWSDFAPFQTAMSVEAVEPAFMFGQVMLLTGQESRDKYGALRVLKSHDEVMNIVWTGYAFPLGHGLLVLEVQEKLYRFLLKCVVLLLRDIDLSSTSVDRHAMVTSKSMECSSTMVPSDPKEWRSVSEVNNQASYHLPQFFSIGT